MLIERTAGDTLTAVEMDHGDELRFTLASGQVRTIKLLTTVAWVTERGRLRQSEGKGILTYCLHARFEIDGHQVEFSRRIPSQDSFRAPWTIMGMRIWLDAVGEVSELLQEAHGECFPKRRVRFAVWDARYRICPPLLHPWCPLPEGSLRIEDCYRGETSWLGPYDGTEAHGGLDINHPSGTPLWAPFPIDDHGFFDRVGAGDSNNRWRGVRTWGSGATWILQAHHVIRLLVPEGEPIPAGIAYAEGAGVSVGHVEHSHFVFRVRDYDEEIMLDPWLLFWQMYEDRKLTTV